MRSADAQAERSTVPSSRSTTELHVEELSAYVNALKTPTLKAETMREMQHVFELHQGVCPVVLSDSHHNPFSKKEAPQFKSARELRLCQYALQLSLLAQCMFQALVVTMLARDAIVEYGAEGGAVLIVLMIVPTLVMSKVVTPLVLQNFSLAHAVVVKQLHVLQEIESEHEQTGDYAHASQVGGLRCVTRVLELFAFG